MDYKTFTEPLINWYLKNHRPLVFRETSDPYHIWVSEIMAQQTQIATMLPYYENWIQRWPSINKLAEADINDVLKAWEGLGYYSRARNLHKSAQLLVEENSAQFPSSVDDMIKLPGIGDYTANAIASIAYKQKAIAIDGNVIRVMSRVLASEKDYLKVKNKNELKVILLNLLEDANPSYFTQALMELGALICLPTSPKCDECPLNQSCLAFKTNTQDNYPLKKVKKKNPVLHYDTFVIIKDKQILMSKDDSDGLMKGLIRLPQQPSKLKLIPIMTSKHIFSHKTWLMNVYDDVSFLKENPLYEWVSLESLNNYSMITAHRVILTSLGHLK